MDLILQNGTQGIGTLPKSVTKNGKRKINIPVALPTNDTMSQAEMVKLMVDIERRRVRNAVARSKSLRGLAGEDLTSYDAELTRVLNTDFNDDDVRDSASTFLDEELNGIQGLGDLGKVKIFAKAKAAITNAAKKVQAAVKTTVKKAVEVAHKVVQ
jgi:hypothetical protein